MSAFRKQGMEREGWKNNRQALLAQRVGFGIIYLIDLLV